MDLVNDYINRKSLTAEPPEITRLVETRYIHFLKWASENGRIMNASTLMSRWWQGGNTAIEERAVSNDIQNRMSTKNTARDINQDITQPAHHNVGGDSNTTSGFNFSGADTPSVVNEAGKLSAPADTSAAAEAAAEAASAAAQQQELLQQEQQQGEEVPPAPANNYESLKAGFQKFPH